MLQLEVTNIIPVISLNPEESAKEDAKILKQLKLRGFDGWSRERYDTYILTHTFYKDYDLSAETREQHDRELAEFRELRDRELRLRLHIELDHTLSDTEKWRDLESTYPLEPYNNKAGWYSTKGSILKFGTRLESEE